MRRIADGIGTKRKSFIALAKTKEHRYPYSISSFLVTALFERRMVDRGVEQEDYV